MEAPIVNEDYLNEIEKARRYLRAVMSSRNCAPLMLHLAWLDAGTYDAKTKTGGPNGSIRNKAHRYKYGANNALKIAIDFCDEVKAKHPEVTYADLYQLAGVVAVEVTGGPTIDFVPGRMDSMESSEEGWHPDGKEGASHLRDTFYRMGLSDKDIVTLSGGYTLGRDVGMLSGGYTLGREHKDKSFYRGPWTKDPLKFDNSYFVELLKKGGESEGLLKFPTDKALVEDPKFRQYVELYAKDEDTFFKDYAALHKKLSELGFTPTSWVSKVAAKFSTILAQGAVPVKFSTILALGTVPITVAATLLIQSYFYEVHERTPPLINVASFINRISSFHCCCNSADPELLL